MVKPAPASAAASPRAKPVTNGFETVVLLLQGGGALGAYQAGVYEALLEHGVEPAWLAGISIGAINSAIIAGNQAAERVARLRAFWEQVSSEPPAMGGFWSSVGNTNRRLANRAAAGATLVRGVPGFFSPRLPPPSFQPRGTVAATSWYDTKDLRRTLERLVDFDRINAHETRLSVGAVNVRTGDFTHFDSAVSKIGADQVMASAALPPAFPAIEIDGEFYWDGGMVSNTPLSWVQSERTKVDTLILQVDLWSARGVMPGDLAQVAVRMKEIQYSSRTRAVTDSFRRTQDLRSAFNALLSRLPPELAALPQAQLLAEAADPAVCNIVELIYRSPTYEDQSKDYEFSRQTMEDHWRAGYRDANETLAHPEIFHRPPTPSAINVFDFLEPAPKPARPEPRPSQPARPSTARRRT